MTRTRAISNTRRRADPGVTRRQFHALAGGTIASFALGGACAGSQQEGSDGRISARPRGTATTVGTGQRSLGLGGSRDGLIHLPVKPAGDRLPLMLLLHGAGGSSAGILRRLGAFADEAGIALLVPDSRSSSWDAIGGHLGPDVIFLNRALDQVFATTAVDPARISIGGFSDGASYALTLGLINGDLFRRVAAFSPGFVVSGAAQGKPKIFISHGTADEILPIDRCSRVIVPALQSRGYDVTFKHFEGGHDIPPFIAKDGMKFAAG
ncbi:MAG: phospholipase [Vicinamibacterales bacterium]